MTPRVSICVPNLNTRPFLEERFATIFAQTFQDWELLVYDSYSDDGAWEYITDVGHRERRMRAWQGPRAGTPGSWSACIREARGEFVYIATSDDTMPPDCLEKLVAALDANPECAVAHCPLRAIDAKGDDVADICQWWSQGSIFALSSGSLLNVPHVRRAPFDGLLHLLGGSVYISLTQLLIRRSLFDRIGMFQPTWGSIGDFNWSMRAGLVGSTVHVPDTWGGWRVHASQATAGAGLGSEGHIRKIDAMIDDAVATCGDYLDPALRDLVTSRWRREAQDLRSYMREIESCRTRADVAGLMLRRALAGSIPAREHVRLKLRGRTVQDWVAKCLEDAGFGPMLVASVGTAAPSPTLAAH